MLPTLGGWKRLVVALVVVASVVAVAGAATTDGQPSGDAVLNDTRERYANAESLVTTVNVTVANATTNETATVEFAASGNQSRTVVTTANATYRTGVNETVGWYVGPNRSVAYDRRSGLRSDDGPTPTLDALRNGSVDDWANATYLRSASDDGTDAHVVEVTHEHDGDRTTATLWIAQSDARLLRVEASDGTNRTVVDYRDTTFNASVHESTFDPPADRLAVTSLTRYDTFEATQANTSLDVPRLDASFREASVLVGSDGTTVAQAYRDEGDNVTVVSTTSDRRFDRADENATTVTVDGHDATVTMVRDRAVVYWEVDGVVTAVVVDASEDRAVELARRLE